MKKKDQNQIKIPKGHGLINRRDFLSHGLMAGVGYAMAPSLMSMLRVGNVYAAEDCFSAINMANRKTPIIMLDLSGGGNVAGSNIIVGDQIGQHSLLATYNRLGIPDNLHPSNNLINSEMGLKFHSMSGMLQGIQQHTTTAIRQKCEGAVFCAVSNDDTENNPHNPVYWLNKAGSIGDIVQTAGSQTGRSGGRSTIPNLSYDPTIAPVPISRPEDCVELISLGRVHNIFNQNQAKRILQTIEYMSESKLNSFSAKSLPEQIREVVACGFSKSKIDQLVHNTDSRFTANAIDPRLDPSVTNIWTNLAGNAQQRKEASIAKLVLDGYLGTGTIEMGGYDYHGQTRSQTDAKDVQVGEAIGRILALAASKQTDVAIYVFTDGGVSTNMQTQDAQANGKYDFTSDDGQRASTFMLVYRHQGRRTLRHTNGNFNTAKRQLGWFKENTSIERSANVMSNNVTNLAKTIVANYLALHNEESRLEEIVGDNPFGTNLSDYLIF
jgi:osmotically-inducible protein OsmY